jgi:hypothetical protein
MTFLTVVGISIHRHSPFRKRKCATRWIRYLFREKIYQCRYFMSTVSLCGSTGKFTFNYLFIFIYFVPQCCGPASHWCGSGSWFLFDADPDPDFYFMRMRIRIRVFAWCGSRSCFFVRIRIRPKCYVAHWVRRSSRVRLAQTVVRRLAVRQARVWIPFQHPYGDPSTERQQWRILSGPQRLRLC